MAKGQIVYVVDAWEALAQESFTGVFRKKGRAKRALKKLVSEPGNWYAAVVRRRVR